MRDLEEEFQKLMEVVRKQILGEMAAGDFTRYEGEELIRMLDERMGGHVYDGREPVEEDRYSWNSSGCSIGNESDDYSDLAPDGGPMEGWSTSMGYRCY